MTKDKKILIIQGHTIAPNDDNGYLSVKTIQGQTVLIFSHNPGKAGQARIEFMQEQAPRREHSVKLEKFNKLTMVCEDLPPSLALRMDNVTVLTLTPNEAT